MARATAIIPARYGSSRLPGKPLLKETGRFLIEHVHERVTAAKSLAQVIVATDDERIRRAVESFGGQVVMTSSTCISGTDRLVDAISSGAVSADTDIVVNVQGDEPEIDPAHIDSLVELASAELSSGPNRAVVSTLAEPLSDSADLQRPQVVKLVTDSAGYALYFSRAAIPFNRNGAVVEPLRHIGIYAYDRRFLMRFADLAPSPLEKAEGLEQLRVMWHGHRIRVGILPAGCGGRGIDTPEDYEAFVRRCRQSESAPND